MIYNEKVMEIFKNPKNVGKLKGANAIGQVGNVACGDIMKIYLKINENDIIEDASFETFGCAAAIVSSSIATEIIKGWTVEQALNFDNDLIIKEVGELPVHKIHCSILAKEAIEDAITKYRKKQAREAKNPKKESAKKTSKVDSKSDSSTTKISIEKSEEKELKKPDLASLNSTLSLLKKVKEEKKIEEVKIDDVVKVEVHDFDENKTLPVDKKAEKKAKKENAKKLNKTFLNLTKKIKKL